jgi:hypothetical protein
MIKNKLLDLEFCLCDQAFFGDAPRRFGPGVLLTCEPIHPQSARFDHAFASKRINLLARLGLAKKGNARMESLASELTSLIYYVGNREGKTILHRLFDSMTRVL